MILTIEYSATELVEKQQALNDVLRELQEEGNKIITVSLGFNSNNFEMHYLITYDNGEKNESN